MNKNYTWLLLCCFLVAGISTAHAQKDWSHLIQTISQSIKQEPQQAIQLNYTQTSVPRSTEQEKQVVKIEIRQEAERQYLLSSQMVYLADGQSAYAIYPSAQKIFVLDEWQRAQQHLQNGASALDIQQLWEGAAIEEITAQQANHQRLRITPTKVMQQVGQVNVLELEYESTTKVLRQSKIYLPETAAYAYLIFDYTHVHKAAKIGLFRQAKNQVFDVQGNLLKKYRHFTVEQR